MASCTPRGQRGKERRRWTRPSCAMRVHMKQNALGVPLSHPRLSRSSCAQLLHTLRESAQLSHSTIAKGCEDSLKVTREVTMEVSGEVMHAAQLAGAAVSGAVSDAIKLTTGISAGSLSSGAISSVGSADRGRDSKLEGGS